LELGADDETYPTLSPLRPEHVRAPLVRAHTHLHLAAAPAIGPVHLAEALQYRSRLAAAFNVLEPE
jgi:hypothetical protein